MKARVLKRKGKHLYNFTGLSVEQFEELCEAVEAELAEVKTKSGQPRQRAVGGGRKANLSLEDQVLTVLMYYRLYITQVLLGYLVGLDDSNVSRLIAKLRPILLTVLPTPARERSLFGQECSSEKRTNSLSDLLAKHPELKEVLLDATEQEVYKPQDPQQRKLNYSVGLTHTTSWDRKVV